MNISFKYLNWVLPKYWINQESFDFCCSIEFSMFCNIRVEKSKTTLAKRWFSGIIPSSNRFFLNFSVCIRPFIVNVCVFSSTKSINSKFSKTFGMFGFYRNNKIALDTRLKKTFFQFILIKVHLRSNLRRFSPNISCCK